MRIWRPRSGEFLASGMLADHPWLWGGDGRITAGHLAVLADRAAAGPLEVILFDGTTGADWNWSERDQAMAQRILSATSSPGACTLVVAGNAHTSARRTVLGVPMGARLAEQRPGVREIRVNYGSGCFYNLKPCRFGPGARQGQPVRLHQHGGQLALDMPLATEAVVPHHPQP